MNKNLTPQEHWELHQGLWKMLGCDMELKRNIEILLCMLIERLIGIIPTHQHQEVFI